MSKETLIIVTTVVSFLLPICLMIYWKFKTKCYWLAYASGALCFMLFVFVIESFVNLYFLQLNPTTSKFLLSNPLAYGIVGAFMAGLFEETGRLFGFKLLLKNHKEKNVAIGYGIGHGGIECVMTLGVTYLMYTMFLLSGTLGDSATDALMLQTINSIDITIIPIALIERIVAIILHIALSVFVYKAANKSKSFYMYPLAILIHTIADIPAGLYQAHILTNVYVVEILVAIISITTFVFATRMYRNMKDEVTQ